MIAAQNKRMEKSMQLLLDDVITGTEYKQIKEECTNNIAKCEIELKNLEQQSEEKIDIQGLAALAVQNLKN
ncbi:hypothetical protein [Pedobacter sp. MC2016-24]|uniref:hypothetical protein n=1 Tax=Pedobacter sp. MC2016-24 TaxID=2780090 RepID=UPI0018809B6D|nr:hypothetical protein [Pedobacter sp. MC2016-24]MBE9600242.1 hypothetical protein [Pedobacter sp. MC2016-24]